jgi:hypothetical protein
MLDNQSHTSHYPIMTNQRVTNLREKLRFTNPKKFQLAQLLAQTDHHLIARANGLH